MPANDLSLAPDYVITQTPTYNTIVSKFENGVEQRRAKRASAIRRWKLEYHNRAVADYTTIVTLFNARKGQAIAFYWTNPLDSTQYYVRFASDQIEFSLKAYNIYDFSFELQEVIA